MRSVITFPIGRPVNAGGQYCSGAARRGRAWRGSAHRQASDSHPTLVRTLHSVAIEGRKQSGKRDAAGGLPWERGERGVKKCPRRRGVANRRRHTPKEALCGYLQAPRPPLHPLHPPGVLTQVQQSVIRNGCAEATQKAAPQAAVKDLQLMSQANRTEQNNSLFNAFLRQRAKKLHGHQSKSKRVRT